MDTKKARSKLSDVRKRMEFIYSNAYFFSGIRGLVILGLGAMDGVDGAIF